MALSLEFSYKSAGIHPLVMAAIQFGAAYGFDRQLNSILGAGRLAWPIPPTTAFYPPGQPFFWPGILFGRLDFFSVEPMMILRRTFRTYARGLRKEVHVAPAVIIWFSP
jgi:hypothetical protein